MGGLNKHQVDFDALEKPDHRNPMINLGMLPMPVGILSMDDGVVVYANDAFRQIIKSTKVGEPIKGFMHTPEICAAIANKLEKTSQYVVLLERPEVSLRFTISEGEFLERPHYFVCIEKINNVSEIKQQLYFSREEFIDQLSRLVDENSNEECSACIIDIDRFRVVNENYGYEAGNYVLNELVQIIKKYIPDKNIVGRLGDNEFGVILNGVKIEENAQICELIREKVKDHSFNFGEENIDITLSIGVLSLTDEQGTLEEILASANLALRSAQENGRNCVHSSATQDTMMAYHSGKMHYAMVIEDALQNDKFELFAQPIVSLSDLNNTFSYEVLLRMFDHKQNEYVSSQELI